MTAINLSQGASKSETLYSRLASVLPAGSSFDFYHASTPPTKGDPLFAPAPGEKQQRTYCESHTLAVSVKPLGGADAQEVLVYAIELLIYTTRTLTTLFVSKADSTGYLGLLPALPPSVGSPIRTITSTFISWLAESRQRPGVRFVVSLFARAQDQYLFPGSIENPGKHVLDDRQLVRWWCKTLDPVLRRKPSTQNAEHEQASAQAYVIVPGFDKYETTSFFPPSWRADPPEAPMWQHGHPLRDVAPNPTAPPRCIVPHFPDDPKARYLDELDAEIPDAATSQTLFSPSKRGRGVWKSIKTLEQFWETMAFRQECSSGRMVGFIWLVFTPSDLTSDPQMSGFGSQRSMSPLSGASQEMPSISGLLSGRTERQTEPATSPRKRSRRKKLTGPVIPRMPRIKSSSSNTSVMSQPQDSPYYSWPEEGRGQVVVDHASYLRLHDLLLRLDFTTEHVAVKSTHKWINEAKAISGTPDGWGRTVAGLLAKSTAATAATGNGVQANDLSGMIVRKKRKVDTAEVPSSQADEPAPIVNVLNNSLIRKRPKGEGV